MNLNEVLKEGREYNPTWDDMEHNYDVDLVAGLVEALERVIGWYEVTGGPSLDRLEQARAMLEVGASQNKTSAEAGLSRGTINRYFPGTAHDKTEGNPLPPERIEELRSAVEDGWSRAEIHRTYGIDRRTANKYLPGTQWSPEQAQEYRSLRAIEAKTEMSIR
jgi:DNA invertase Pin-like site-specific DNA recombinase